MTTPATSHGAVPAGSTSRLRRVRNASVIAVTYLLALGGVMVGALTLSLLDESTKIDRSTPQVVAHQFLDATLVLRDLDRIALFICEDWSAQAAIDAADPPADGRVSVSWGDTVVVTSGSVSATAQVRVEFVVTIGGVSSRSIRVWELEMRNSDGWRVCGLSKESLNP